MTIDPPSVMLAVEYRADRSQVRGAEFALPIRKALRDSGIPAYLVDIAEPLPEGPFEGPAPILLPVVENTVSSTPGTRRICAREVAQRNGIPLVGSGPQQAEEANDKERTAALLKRAGLSVPDGFSIKVQAAEQAVRPEFPAVVKPRFEGGSKGVRQVENQEQYTAHLVRLRERGVDECRVEPYLPGTECSIWLVERPAAPPLMGGVSFWRRFGEILDREFKSDQQLAPSSRTPILLPSPADPAACPIFGTVLAAHRLLGLRGYSRTDLVVVRGKPFVIEVNATPTLSETGPLSPALALSRPFAEILRQLIATAQTPDCDLEAPA